MRPDPMITTSSSMAMLSADTRGSATVSDGQHPQGAVAINSVGNPNMQYHSTSEAKMNLLAFMNPDGTGITDLHVNGFDPQSLPTAPRSHSALCVTTSTRKSM